MFTQAPTITAVGKSGASGSPAAARAHTVRMFADPQCTKFDIGVSRHMTSG